MLIKIREVTQPEEISRAFSHLQTDRSRVLLWQTIKSDTNKKILIHCEMVSINQRNIYLAPINIKTSDLLNKKISINNKIFIRGTQNGVLFKSENFKIVNGKIEIPIPDKILLSEKRYQNRYSIPFSKHAFIKFENKSNSLKRTSKMRIEDISLEGFSIQMKRNESPFYEVNKTYEIVNILGISVTGIYATLVYQTVHNYIKDGKTKIVFKAGFKLKQKLPNAIYQELLNLIEQKEIAA